MGFSAFMDQSQFYENIFFKPQKRLAVSPNSSFIYSVYSFFIYTVVEVTVWRGFLKWSFWKVDKIIEKKYWKTIHLVGCWRPISSKINSLKCIFEEFCKHLFLFILLKFRKISKYFQGTPLTQMACMSSKSAIETSNQGVKSVQSLQ